MRMMTSEEYNDKTTGYNDGRATTEAALDSLVEQATDALDNAMSVGDNEKYRVKLLQLCPDMIDAITTLRAERDAAREDACWNYVNAAFDDNAEDAKSAYARGVRVKPLVFEYGLADSIIGRWRVECSLHGVWFVSVPGETSPAAMKTYKSEFEAVEALQADYEARILATLQPQSEGGEG